MTWIVCFVCTHGIEIGRVFLPLIANMLFVSITFSLEKVFVRFSAFVNFNIMLGSVLVSGQPCSIHRIRATIALEMSSSTTTKSSSISPTYRARFESYLSRSITCSPKTLDCHTVFIPKRVHRKIEKTSFQDFIVQLS